MSNAATRIEHLVNAIRLLSIPERRKANRADSVKLAAELLAEANR